MAKAMPMATLKLITCGFTKLHLLSLVQTV